MRYEVVYAGKETNITIDKTKAKITTDAPIPGTAFAIGTLYQAQRGFVPVAIYQFQALGDASAENLKNLARFFFSSLLDTEWYVLEIPRESALFPEEAQRIFGTANYERAV